VNGHCGSGHWTIRRGEPSGDFGRKERLARAKGPARHGSIIALSFATSGVRRVWWLGTMFALFKDLLEQDIPAAGPSHIRKHP
jgi:hypothetical protein